MLDFWRPQPIFAGQTVFVVGGGPSLRRQDLTALRGRPTIVVNQMAHELPWADVLFFGDESWLLKYPENLALVASWRGLATTASHTAQMTLPEKVLRVHFHRIEGRVVLHRPPGHSAGWGRSSGHKGVALAVLLGSPLVVMLGFDCRMVEDRSHAHDAYRHASSGTYDEWLLAWRGWRAAADRVGVRIVNATPDSAVDEFERVDLENFL